MPLTFLGPWKDFAASLGMRPDARGGTELKSRGPVREVSSCARILARISGNRSTHARSHRTISAPLRRLCCSRAQTSAKALPATQRRASNDAALLASPAAIYDAWIDCAEEAYAQAAHGEPFARLLADLCNILSAFKIERGKLLEALARQFDWPSRAEVDSLHRQVRAPDPRRPQRRPSRPTRRPEQRPKAKADGEVEGEREGNRREGQRRGPKRRASRQEQGPQTSPQVTAAANRSLDCCRMPQRCRSAGKSAMRALREIGDVQVGLSEKSCVYADNKIQLHRYAPLARSAKLPPLLICYAMVNRPYMLDLQPDRSLIRELLLLGVDVYLLDWGYPDGADRFTPLTEYVCGHLGRCVRIHPANKNAIDALNLLGVCQGGTMSLCHAALEPRRSPTSSRWCRRWISKRRKTCCRSGRNTSISID